MREAAGWSRRQLANECGVSATSVGAAEALKYWPQAGVQQKIADALRTHPEIIFPEDLHEAYGRLTHRKIETSVSVEALPFSEARQLTTTDLDIDPLSDPELMESLRQAMKTLSPRERQVINMRFGLETGRPLRLREVAQEFGVTTERIRQIEAKAFRRLRHPSRSRYLRDFLDGDVVPAAPESPSYISEKSDRHMAQAWPARPPRGAPVSQLRKWVHEAYKAGKRDFTASESRLLAQSLRW